MYGKVKGVSYIQEINTQTFAGALDFSRNEIEAFLKYVKIDQPWLYRKNFFSIVISVTVLQRG